MGIEDYLLTSTIAGVMAQRLVRSLCAACRRPSDLPEFLHAPATKRRDAGKTTDFFESAGCSSCRGTGYRGRTVIAEMMDMNDLVRRTVLAKAEASQLRAAAIRSGMKTLYENGLDAVFDGTTSHEEVLRVAQDLQG
jgi:general secretion pathway protein E